MKKYKSEASINKVLAEFQLANAAICNDCCEENEESLNNEGHENAHVTEKGAI